ncbi:hypothetical protein FHT77_002957 [Rhizobium sp. BK181]|uniref:hypothetical protein n=1 Tax=Rhizobium sp. BK181 TaxID=2587072 RepID=UPI001620C08D|nr:hypothetical protein [Rhizobium sp. BK181]MBB3317075.1 hypothetical protein [Rhizobium sp. BK181]
MNRALMAAAVAALFGLSNFAPAAAASSAAKKGTPTAVSKQTTGSTTPMTNRFLTPRMMDRKRSMNPVCDQGFKSGAPSSCHY